MSDWNPAEIIGSRPKQLAESLYREIVTDKAWSKSRKELGNRDLTGVPLMLVVAGKPYIDVTASFNSFLPSSLDDKSCEELIKAYISRLLRFPELHDKVEFDIVPTCLKIVPHKFGPILFPPPALTL